MKTLEQLFDKLGKLAKKNECTLYEICFRNAGVGIVWHETAKVPIALKNQLLEEPTDKEELKKFIRAGKLGKNISQMTKEGLVLYRYYPTLRKYILGEIKRLIKEPL